MLRNILIIIGIVLIVLFIALIYLVIIPLCKILSEKSRKEEEFSIGFLEEIDKKS